MLQLPFSVYFLFLLNGSVKEKPNNDESFYPWLVSLWLYSTMKSYRLLKNEKIVFRKFKRIPDFIEETASIELYLVRRCIKFNEFFLYECKTRWVPVRLVGNYRDTNKKQVWQKQQGC